MAEIKVGEYIITVAGYIGKIINFSDGMYTAKMKDAIIDLYIDDIENHKENIIDLIEEGDYVNGELVTAVIELFDENNEDVIGKKLITQYRTAQYSGLDSRYYLHQQDIKSIVTKEQFEKIKYIVGDESNVNKGVD